MGDLEKSVMSLLASELFAGLLNSDVITIAKLNAIIALLVKTGIPFDLSFTPGTRDKVPQAELTIPINPKTTISFTFEFQSPII